MEQNFAFEVLMSESVPSSTCRFACCGEYPFYWSRRTRNCKNVFATEERSG